eukprot:4862982-Pyramimonas_sp.AAC.2
MSSYIYNPTTEQRCPDRQPCDAFKPINMSWYSVAFNSSIPAAVGGVAVGAAVGILDGASEDTWSIFLPAA